MNTKEKRIIDKTRGYASDNVDLISSFNFLLTKPSTNIKTPHIAHSQMRDGTPRKKPAKVGVRGSCGFYSENQVGRPAAYTGATR